MPQRINRLPLGYLDILQAQTGGKYPQDVADLVSPVLDLNTLYLQHALGAENVTLPHVNAGTSLDTNVPAGQVWILWGASWQVTPPLTTDFEQWDVQVRHLPEQFGTAPFPQMLVSPLMQSLVAGQAVVANANFPQPIALPSGTQLRCRVFSRDTGGVSRTTRIQYYGHFINT